MPGSQLFILSHAAFNLIFWAIHYFIWPPAILGAILSSWIFAFLVLIGSYEIYEEVNIFQKMFGVVCIVLIPMIQSLSLVEIEWADPHKLIKPAIYPFAASVLIGLILSHLNRGLRFYRWRDNLAAIVSLFGLSVIFVSILNQSFQLHAKSKFKAFVREKRIDNVVRAGLRYKIMIQPDRNEPVRDFAVAPDEYKTIKAGDFVPICRYEGLLKIESFWICNR